MAPIRYFLLCESKGSLVYGITVKYFMDKDVPSLDLNQNRVKYGSTMVVSVLNA